MTANTPQLNLVLSTGGLAGQTISVGGDETQGEVHIHLHLGSSVTPGIPESKAQVPVVSPRARLPWAGLGVAGTALLVVGYVVGGLGGSHASTIPAPLTLPMPSMPPDTASLRQALTQPPSITPPPTAAAAPNGKNAFGLEN